LEHFESIIVGAGYAGMAAAAQMPGRELLVIERYDSIVQKRRGSLGFLFPVGEQVEVRGNDLYLNGLELLVENGVRQAFRNIQIRGNRERLDLALRHPLILINEGRLKGALLRRIRENGTEVKVGSAVREVDTDGREVTVRTSSEYSARILLGADGVGSVVARSLRFRRDRLAILFQREVELSHLDIPADTLYLQIDDARNLFFAFPVGDHYQASVIQIVAAREVPEDLEEKLIDKVERLGGGRLLAGRNAVVRLFSPAASSYRGNVLLTGDALATYGFATITGALAMGTLAGAAINRFLAGSHYALPEYHDKWRKVSGHTNIERIRYALPILSRIEGNRVDRILKAAHRPGQVYSGVANLLWHLPAILWRLFV
jgi:flavin-dependent dehydrogenase